VPTSSNCLGRLVTTGGVQLRPEPVAGVRRAAGVYLYPVGEPVSGSNSFMGLPLGSVPVIRSLTGELRKVSSMPGVTGLTGPGV